MPDSISRIHALSTFSVCVDGSFKSGCSGRLYHGYSTKEINISEPISLFLVMDNIFDSIGFPQSSTQTRKFRANRKISGTAQGGYSVVMKEEDIFSKRGDKGTFVVHVRSRQNATWQGRVTWAEKKQSQNFRSALELLKLIDCALEEDDLRSE